MRARLRAPLLGRELIETASRPRMYVLRLIILALGALALAQVLLSGRTQASWVQSGSRWILVEFPAFSLVGRGVELIEPVLLLVLISVLLLLPTTAALSIAAERRNGTLVLLLLTPQRPLVLILEKFASQLLSSATLLLVVLPLFTIGYVAGGMDDGLFARLVGLTVLLLLQTTALALAVGAWSRSPTGAIIGANALALLLQVGMLLAIAWSNHQAMLPAWTSLAAVSIGFTSSIAESLHTCVGVLVMTMACLFLAWWGILARPTQSDGAGMARFFQWLDRIWEGIDARWFGIRRHRDLPVHRPVRWLEMNRRSLCNLRYLIRLLLPIAIVILFLAVSCATQQEIAARVRLQQLLATLLALNIAIQSILGAGLFARDRMDQSLAVLQSTPVPMARVLQEKVAAVSRIRWGLTGCTCIVVVMEYLTFHDLTTVMLHLVLAVFLPIIGTWVGVLSGLVIRDHLRAVLAALAVITLWYVGPLLVINLPHLIVGGTTGEIVRWGHQHPGIASLRTVADPLRLLVDLGGWPVSAANDLAWVAMGVAWTLGVMGVLRSMVLRSAPSLLRRMGSEDHP